MASQREPGPPKSSKKQSIPAPVNKIRLRIENVIGRKLTLAVPLNASILEVKRFLTNLHGINTDRQSLVRCGTGNYKDRYTHLEDGKTLQDYGMEDNERLLLIPVVRSGPLTEPSRSKGVKVFVENEEKVNEVIDRMLNEAGRKRREDCHYILAQLDNQKPGDYTILEIPMSKSSLTDSTDPSSEKAPPRQLTELENKQNLKTHSRMKKLREKMEQQRKKSQKLPPTPVATTERPCASCGELTMNSECKCDRVICPKHDKNHLCTKDQGCPQQ